MRNVFILISFLVLNFSFAQENKDSIQVNPVVEKTKKKGSFAEYIKKNFNFPHKNVRGRIVLEFVVDTDGSLTDFKVLEDNIGLGATDELIRVLKNCPKWKPGMKDGIPVKVAYKLPFNIDQ